MADDPDPPQRPAPTPAAEPEPEAPRPHPWRWPIAVTPLLLGLGVERWFATHPARAEAYYTDLFPRLHEPMVALSSALPSWLCPTEATLGLLVLVGALLAWRGWRRWRRGQATLGRVLDSGVRRALLVTGVLLLWFLNWGALYHRAPVETRWGLDVDGVTDADVARLASDAAALANRLGAALPGPLPPETLATQRARLSPQVHAIATERDRAPRLSEAPARVPHVWPVIDALGIDGIASPFYREALINGALVPPERGATLAHEIAHTVGYAREGEASLVGALACLRSPHPRDRYAGAIYVLHYTWRVRQPDGRQTLALLSPRVRADLEREWARNRARRGVLTRAQRAVNDTYLRAAGDPDGVASYGRVVRLLAAARRQRAIGLAD